MLELKRSKRDRKFKAKDYLGKQKQKNRKANKPSAYQFLKIAKINSGGKSKEYLKKCRRKLVLQKGKTAICYRKSNKA